MTTTKAIVAREPPTLGKTVWEMEDISISEPGDNEVLVQIVACGICHTDIVLSSVPQGVMGISYPRIMGHEGAGYIIKTGRNVTTASPGDPVLLSFYSCGKCPSCTTNHPAYCASFVTGNCIGMNEPAVARDETGEAIWARFFGQSSFSRSSIVAEESVVNVKGLVNGLEELRLFAPLGCGFQTGVGAIENVVDAGKEDVVVILGLGSVGLAALMTAGMRGCKTIIGVDRVASRLDLARDLGATHTIDTSTGEKSISDSVREIYSPGATVVIETTGVPVVIEDGLQALGTRGKMVMIGVAPPGYKLGIDVNENIGAGRSVMGCIEGDCVPKEAIPRMIQWYREGRFPVDRLISFYEADLFKDALAALHDGIAIKAVLLWKE